MRYLARFNCLLCRAALTPSLPPCTSSNEQFQQLALSLDGFEGAGGGPAAAGGESFGLFPPLRRQLTSLVETTAADHFEPSRSKSFSEPFIQCWVCTS